MWPDWKGETAVIVATGPSASDVPLALAEGRAKFVAVNRSWKLVPWADVLYASDRSFWESNEGVPDFRGLKLSASPRAVVLYPDIKTVRLIHTDRILVDPVGTIGMGSKQGNAGSGFHAVNLAVQFGSKRVILVGFDESQALGNCADQFKALGVEVLNASPLSALKNYPKVDFQEAIAGVSDVASRPRRSNRPRHRVDAEREPVAESAVSNTSGIREGTDRGSEADEQVSAGSGNSTQDIC